MRTSMRIVLIAACLMLGAAEAGAQAGGTLVLGLDQEPPTVDPHASPSAVTYQIIASVTECLLYKAPDGKLVPWLAESWTVAKDGRSVTFKLRRDVKFPDGTPFNADAVKFNFDRIVDPKFKAGGARAQLAGYAGSKVLDEFTVQVSFETPYAPFLTYAAAGTLSIVSPKAVWETGDLVHTRPVGTGPFMIKDYVAKDHTTMVRNPAYARKAPGSEHAGPPCSRAPRSRRRPRSPPSCSTIPRCGRPIRSIRPGPGHCSPRRAGSPAATASGARPASAWRSCSTRSSTAAGPIRPPSSSSP